MHVRHATVVVAVITTALVAPTATAHSPSDARSSDAVAPVMKYAKTSAYACRGRSDGFSTVTFMAANRGETRSFAKAWADNGYHAEIGSQRLAAGGRAELGEFGTTGSTDNVEFHLLIRANGETRTKVLIGSDLPKC